MNFDAEPIVICGDTPHYQFLALLAAVPADEKEQVLRDLRLIAVTKLALPPLAAVP